MRPLFQDILFITYRGMILYKTALISAVTGMVKIHVTTRRPMVLLSIVPSPQAKAVPIMAPTPIMDVETGRPYPK